MKNTKNSHPCGKLNSKILTVFKSIYKLAAITIFGLLIVSTGNSKDLEVVAIPQKSLIFNEDKVGILVKITNLTVDKDFLLMGGLIDKNGTVYPRSVEYDLTFYKMKDHAFIEKSTTTGFLSQEFPTEESNYASKSVSIKLGGQQTLYYFFEITPFPKAQEGNYCVFKFRLPINNQMKEMVINLERNSNHKRTDKK